LTESHDTSGVDNLGGSLTTVVAKFIEWFQTTAFHSHLCCEFYGTDQAILLVGAGGFEPPTSAL
jgi:hypothetical protein